MSCLAPLGRLDDALQEILLAQAIDPISSIIARDLALTYYYRGESELSLEKCDRTIEQNPHFSATYWALGLIQQQLGDFEESVAAFERVTQLSPQTIALSGKPEDAKRILREPARSLEETLRLAVRVFFDALRPRRAGPRLQLACQGVPGPLF
jgi:tetratricopeptide (TPR) repeat protein